MPYHVSKMLCFNGHMSIRLIVNKMSIDSYNETVDKMPLIIKEGDRARDGFYLQKKPIITRIKAYKGGFRGSPVEKSCTCGLLRTLSFIQYREFKFHFTSSFQS